MKKPLDIVIFDGSFKTTAFIRRLTAGLSKTHRVYVFGFSESFAEKLPNVTYVALGSASRPVRLFWLSLKFSFQLLASGNLAGFLSYCGLLCTFDKKALQQKNVVTAVSLLAPDLIHVQWPSLLPWCEPFLARSFPKIILSQRGYQNNVRPFVDSGNRAYLQEIYPQVDGFHSVSKAMAATSDDLYSAKDKIDHVIYSGFELEKLRFQEDYRKNDKLQILSVGRPHWIKGYTYALRACKLLKEQGVSFTYTIIGAAKNEELQYLIKAFGLGAEVVLTSRISQGEVYEKVRSSDVLLFPSLKEGMPNVIVEAMAIGLPVIATNCGGVRELLDETTGIVIPTRDPKAMAAAVQQFIATPLETIQAQRRAARLRVEQRHTVAEMVQGMEALYYEVVRKSNA